MKIYIKIQGKIINNNLKKMIALKINQDQEENQFLYKKIKF